MMLAELEVPVRSDLVFWYVSELERLPEIDAWLAPRSVEIFHMARHGDAGQMDHLASRLVW